MAEKLHIAVHLVGGEINPVLFAQSGDLLKLFS
jgi:hypothetical protein